MNDFMTKLKDFIDNRVKWQMLGERAGIDHYTCHTCRNK